MLKLVPISLRDANSFVDSYHRHHKPVQGHKFSIGCSEDGKIVGVVIVGRPVSRYLDDGQTIEVTRLCTDGTHNACSILYAAAWRAARSMGYARIITYILENENGASLRAAGWHKDYITTGGSWNCTSRPRRDKAPICPKVRYSKT